ncbi:MAG: hypothetical protein AAGA66_13625 [Bacteroidota bacterium]
MMYRNLKAWPDFHHRINLVYHGVIAFSLIPFALIFLNIDSGLSQKPIVGERYLIFIYVGTIPLIAATFVLVWRHAKEKLATITNHKDLRQRIISYLGFQTKRYLWLELGAIISLLGMWLSLNFIYILAYLLALVQFSFLRPSQDKMIRDLQFDKEERQKLGQETL